MMAILLRYGLLMQSVRTGEREGEISLFALVMKATLSAAAAITESFGAVPFKVWSHEMLLLLLALIAHLDFVTHDGSSAAT
jgi:hypothetical protein